MKRGNMRNEHVRRGLTVAVMVGLLSFSCTSEFARNVAPVELVVTNTQKITTFDLAGGEGCAETPVDIQLRTIVKSDTDLAQGPDIDRTRFNDVRVTRYRVSFARADGGTVVPAPFVRATDLLIAPGGTAPVTTFVLITGDALNQAPFVSLRPENNGRDPETGRRVISMEVIVDFFGETLAGANVSGRTRFQLDFCFACGGCQ